MKLAIKLNFKILKSFLVNKKDFILVFVFYIYEINKHCFWIIT